MSCIYTHINISCLKLFKHLSIPFESSGYIPILPNVKPPWLVLLAPCFWLPSSNWETWLPLYLICLFISLKPECANLSSLLMHLPANLHHPTLRPCPSLSSTVSNQRRLLIPLCFLHIDTLFSNSDSDTPHRTMYLMFKNILFIPLSLTSHTGSPPAKAFLTLLWLQPTTLDGFPPYLLD